MADEDLREERARIDDVIAEYLEAIDRGEAIDVDHLLSQHPTIAAELGAFFSDLESLKNLVKPIRQIESIATQTLHLSSLEPACESVDTSVSIDDLTHSNKPNLHKDLHANKLTANTVLGSAARC